VRNTLRPMRPKPLMPTFTAMIVPAPVYLLCEDSKSPPTLGFEAHPVIDEFRVLVVSSMLAPGLGRRNARRRMV